jgi:hypothetical protein
LAQYRKLTIEEVDTILEELDTAMEKPSAFVSKPIAEIELIFNKIVERCLSIDDPGKIWEQFSEYCKQNELDPAQQMREAVISYYKDMLRIYRIRLMLRSH